MAAFAFILFCVRPITVTDSECDDAHSKWTYSAALGRFSALATRYEVIAADGCTRPEPEPPRRRRRRQRSGGEIAPAHRQLCPPAAAVFMFRSKRNALVKRLWKYRVVNDERSQQHQQQDADEEMEMKAAAHAVLKRLKEVQLGVLARAVVSRGGDESGCGSSGSDSTDGGVAATSSSCVPVAGVVSRCGLLPHVVCCRIWRWPDVKSPYELKRLACCKLGEDPLFDCCNPYHWSKLCKPESPPPPYSRFALERFKPEDRSPSEVVSLATGGTNQYGSFSSHSAGGNGNGANHWCNIAYWELRTRVGRLFPVHKPWVNVFADVPHGDGLSLGAVAKQHNTGNETVRRTRDKIGYGLTLSQEEDGVWVYNRSDHAIFVNSPTLHSLAGTAASHGRALVVHRVPPGHSIKIFDYDKSAYYQHFSEPELNADGPFDPNSVRISFAKGWGPKYSRQVITSCPCWLEVLLVPRVPR